MIAKALGLSGSNASHFDDVTENTSCAGYINALAEVGLVQGTGNGRFCPDQTLTRQDFYTLLARMMRYLNLNWEYASRKVTQEQLDRMNALGFAHWADDDAALLELAEMVDFDSGMVEPAEGIRRGEAAAGMYAMLASAGVLY